ncbi:hypothetical protein [Vibrio phage vB_VmeM-Yong XC32]|nr:hypothetical protein [Vibrio phage vB_VmeM-Yong XC31]QAX96601.1 hypothetical protein [Vibrio phage vB_VmeM-Yong XC32]QAX96919.1 hypothetical protein [Vibrio phage vB_VmeM-Yong MS31]QAX97224.1 hypothetical protein [Vibrio phage vB_VmeM-Yong MS32]
MQLKPFNPNAGEYSYPGTSNHSFNILSETLREMRVGNYKYPLRVKFPETIGLDPWSEDLTDQEKGIIFFECRENKTYFFREVLRVYNPGLSEYLPFKISTETLGILYAVDNHLEDVWFQAGRQDGKTIWGLGLELHTLLFETNVTQVYLESNRTITEHHFNSMLKKKIIAVPEWLFEAFDYSMSDHLDLVQIADTVLYGGFEQKAKKNGTESLHYWPSHDNEVAINQCRSLSPARLTVDNIEHSRHGLATWQTQLMASCAARDCRKKRELPTLTNYYSTDHWHEGSRFQTDMARHLGKSRAWIMWHPSLLDADYIFPSLMVRKYRSSH